MRFIPKTTSPGEVQHRSKRAGSNFGRGRVIDFGDEESASHYIARISGKYEYVENASIPIHSIRYIQECLKRNKKINIPITATIITHFPFIFI